MNLVTNRLILRPWNESDVDELYFLAKDPLVGPQCGWTAHKDINESLSVLKNILMVPYTFAVTLKNGKVIGCISLTFNKDSKTEAELGFWLGSFYFGHGLMPEAIREIMRFAFIDLKLTTIWCSYFEDNIQSKKCQLKCGFSYNHIEKDIYFKAIDKTKTLVVNKITKDDWKTSFTYKLVDQKKNLELLDFVLKVFDECLAPIYTEEGSKMFKKSIYQLNYFKNITFYAAYYKNELVGVLGMDTYKDHICLYFVDKKYQNIGIGKNLFMLVNNYKSYNTITVNASPIALKFYEALGFKKMDEEHDVKGVRYIPMIYNK